MAIPQNPKELLEKWHLRLGYTQQSQYEAAKPLVRKNYWFGIPVVVISSIVGTAVFATLQKQVDPRLQIAVGLVSVAAAVLASLQTFLKFSERAESFRAAGARAGSLRREIEQLLATQSDQSIASDTLDHLRERVDKLAEESPTVPNSIWDKTKKMLNSRIDEK